MRDDPLKVAASSGRTSWIWTRQKYEKDTAAAAASKMTPGMRAELDDKPQKRKV